MRHFFIFCGICCFIAIIKLPTSFYTFLRIAISIGSLMAIYHWFYQKVYFLAIVFAIILVLFNPVIPIHLYRKHFWIPFDILTGLLFLISAFIKKKERNIAQASAPITSPKTYIRDRIILPKKPDL